MKGEQHTHKHERRRTQMAPESAALASQAKTAPMLARLAGVEVAELAPDVRDAVMKLIGEVDKLNNEAGTLRKRVAELEDIADMDPLLPVHNRRAFTRDLSRAMAFAQRHGLGGALVYVDLDGFKGVNDGYGHAAGDLVLQHIADLLNSHVRESDLVGRLGGDEFGVLLAAADDEGAQAKAKDLVNLIREQHIDVGVTEICIGASAGVQNFQPELSAEELLDLADKAMYAHKQAKGCAA